MLRVFSGMALGLVLFFVFGNPSAWAQPAAKSAEPKAAAADPAKPPAAPPTDTASAPQPGGTLEILEAKLTSGIEGGQAKDEMTTFSAGERAWLWMKTKVVGETTFRLRWAWAPDQSWTMDPVTARNGRLWYYKTLHQAGSWKVEVLAANDQVLKEMSFTVNAAGEPAPAKTP